MLLSTISSCLKYSLSQNITFADCDIIFVTCVNQNIKRKKLNVSALSALQVSLTMSYVTKTTVFKFSF